MIQFTFTAKSKLFLSFLLLPLILALAQLDILNELEGSAPNCSGKNIMNGSVLESNLKVVLSSLVENVNKTGYNISWHGDNGDKIYGLVQCRADVNPPTCRECASAAQDHLHESCGGSSNGSVQLKGCFMRYDTHNFYSQLSNTMITVQCVNATWGLDGSISNLLWTIMEKAVSSDVRSSTGNENGIYSLAQCWRDLNTSLCSQCLNTVYKVLLECPQTNGFTENCMIRYETYKFYADAVSSPSPPGGSGPPLPPSGETGKGRPNLLLSIGLTIVGVVIVLLLGLFLIWKRKVIQHFYKKPLPGHSKLSNELSTALSKSKLNYKYSTLRAATENFNPANKIGEGGFGSVYKGVLPNGNEIAVKRLFTDKEQSVSDFFNEVTLISNVQHRNLVKLLGCSVDSTYRLLVYEYLPNKSLDLFLFDENMAKLLDWQRRFEIIVGIAAGLTYLHQESDIRIIHRDIKTNNILLDQHFKPKIADFGLVRYFAEDQTHLNTTIVGTRGYMAPEYLIHGHLTEKVDIYAFWILVLEIISGKKNKTPMYFNDMPSLLTVASARLRPSMSEVMMFLTSKDLNLPATTEPPFVDVDYSQSSVHTSVASASTSETRNPASSSAAPLSSNTISTSSFGPR